MATRTTTKKSTSTKTPANGKPRSTREIAADVTKQAIAAIDAGVPIWQKPWTSSIEMPTSLSTGKWYRGINVLLLILAAQEKGYSSHLWGTFNQMAERAGCVKTVSMVNGKERTKWVSPDGQNRGVRKGERSTEIVLSIILKKEEWDETQGKMVIKRIPLRRYWHVFNTEQCDFPDGIKGIKLAERTADFSPIEEAETIMANYLAREDGLTLHHGGTQAFYRPPTDEIHMPVPEDFTSPEHYYSTLFHEATHSSGKPGRVSKEGREGINMNTFGPFGSPVYSAEELIAEIGAAILCAVAGMNQAQTIPATAAYLKHWRDQLTGDNLLIIRAAGQAQRAVDHILGTTFKDESETEDAGVEEVAAS